MAQMVLLGTSFLRQLDFILLGLALEFVGDFVTVSLFLFSVSIYLSLSGMHFSRAAPLGHTHTHTHTHTQVCMFAQTASLGGGTRMLLSLASSSSSSFSFPPENSARTTLLHAGRMIVRGLLLFALSLIICLVFSFFSFIVFFCLRALKQNSFVVIFFICFSKHETRKHTPKGFLFFQTQNTNTHTQGWGGIAAGAGGGTSRGGGSGWNPRTNSTGEKQK